MDPSSKLCGTKHLIGEASNPNAKKQKSVDSEPKKGKEFYCEICRVTCNSRETMNSHLNGVKHTVKEAKLKMEESGHKKEVEVDSVKKLTIEESNENEGGLWCKICNVRCTGEATMASHLNGKKHKAKREKLGLLGGQEQIVDFNGVECDSQKEKGDFDLKKDGQENSELMEDKSQNVEDGDVFDEGVWCLFCRVKFTDQAMMTNHLTTIYHKSKEEKHMQTMAMVEVDSDEC